MHRHSLSVGLFAIGLLAGATTAQAEIATWVSGTGTDAGNCPITAPCRTFQFAHDQTNNNGAINVLSSGNFGPLTITKAISIVAQDVEAVINTTPGSSAILVQTNDAAVVSLRGLTIDLLDGPKAGIRFVSGAALHVHNSVIRRSTNGISFAPASGASELYVTDTVIANATNLGISVVPTESGGANVVLERVRVENGRNSGILFSGNLTSGSIVATVRESSVAGNAEMGIRAVEFGGGTITVMIDRSTVVNNGTGIFAAAGTTIRMGNSTVTGNGTGLSASGGSILSYGTNKVNGNDSDGAPTGAAIEK